MRLLPFVCLTYHCLRLTLSKGTLLKVGTLIVWLSKTKQKQVFPPPLTFYCDAHAMKEQKGIFIVGDEE